MTQHKKSDVIMLSTRLVCLLGASILSASSIAAAATYTTAQCALDHVESKELLRDCPPSVRIHLAERMQQFARHERERNWSALYSMLGPLYLQGESRENYIARRDRYSNDTIISFSPLYDLPGMDDTWTIKGCIEVRTQVGTYTSMASIGVYLIEDEFFFSDFLIERVDEGN